MQEEQINISSDQMSQKSTVSIGVLLANSRNHAALSQADVADQINLPIRIIKALEEDDFEQLPASTYVRGYLRNYARAVEADAEDMIAAYNEQHHVEAEISPRASLKYSYDSAILWSTAAVFTILVGLLVNWWVDEKQLPEQNREVVNNTSVAVPSDTEIQLTTQIAKTPTKNADVTVASTIEEVSSPFPPQEDEAQASNSSTDEMLNADVEQAMEEESLNPNLVTMSDGSDVLTVTYVEKSWTEIKDADLNPLMQGLIEPGVVRNLSGKAPFHIFLGNSPGVVIEVNGQYFDHSEYNRSNRTARFQVSNSSFN